MSSPSVALLIPDRLLRTGIQTLIGHDAAARFPVVAFDSLEALLATTTATLLLMDISSLTLRQAELRLTQITHARPDLRVLLISTRRSAVLIQRLMQRGAHGFLLRDELADTLLTSLDLASRDMTALSPSAANCLLFHQHLLRTHDIKSSDLHVLRLTAQGLTVKAIAARLGISTRSIYRIRDKLRLLLGIPNIETLVDAAREQGLLDLDDDFFT